mgnify:CR=1 FL=1
MLFRSRCKDDSQRGHRRDVAEVDSCRVVHQRGFEKAQAVEEIVVHHLEEPDLLPRVAPGSSHEVIRESESPRREIAHDAKNEIDNVDGPRLNRAPP